MRIGNLISPAATAVLVPFKLQYRQPHQTNNDDTGTAGEADKNRRSEGS
jgi:hypothetical protein